MDRLQIGNRSSVKSIASGSSGTTHPQADVVMSVDLFQNIMRTMSELHSLERAGVISLKILQRQIQAGYVPVSPIERVIGEAEEYTTGIGETLQGNPGNLKRERCGHRD